MPQKIRDVMTKEVVKLPKSATVIDAARHMRDSHIGAVVLEEGGKPVGLITDRDVAIRSVAEGRDPNKAQLSDIASGDLVTLSPDDEVDHALQIMRKHCVRRVPVVERDQVVGMLSLGDLAIHRDASSVLGSISSAPPNR
jgi:CBS domain-containing protein